MGWSGRAPSLSACKLAGGTVAKAARAALDIHDGLKRLSANLGRRLEAHIGIASSSPAL
jgi:hypothetical protein